MRASLESLQHLFAESLETEQRPVLAQLRTDAALQKRIDLYRNNVRAHRRDALASAYPVLRALVGERYFGALSNAYAHEHPSQSGDLNRFGAALPDFIGRYETDAPYRYFADLTRLEWSLHVAYYAADTATLTQQEWAASVLTICSMHHSRSTPLVRWLLRVTPSPISGPPINRTARCRRRSIRRLTL